MSAIELSTWVEAAVEAADELATVALGLESPTRATESGDLPPKLVGALISIIGEGETLEVGFTSDHDGCQAMARALMCMEPDEPDLERDEVADSVGELANMVAGGLKTRMSAHSPGLRLGLPLFVDGSVDASRASEISVTELQVGGMTWNLLVMREIVKA